MFQAQIGSSARLGFDWEAARRMPQQYTAMDAARTLWVAMQRAGFYYSELMEHCKDLANGCLLTADNGTAFRVVKV
jgi:hypothetical protein